jgi:hypothetical protein
MKWALLTSAGIGVFISACTGYIEAPVGSASAGAPPGHAGGGGTGGTNPGTAGTGGAGTNGEYCEVLSLLRERCAGCHSNPPIRGVPMALVDAADLMTEAPDYPGRSSIDVSIERMRSAESPMPPPPAAPASAGETAALERWLAAGMPAECESGLGGAGGSTGDPYDTPPVCSSETTWRRGEEGSADMHPGRACISCHARGDEEEGEDEGPRFSFAGTVYPTAHEPDDCNGLDGRTESTRVLVVDNAGATFSMKVNSAGNFYLEQRDDVALPYRAKVVSGGRERVMATAPMTGDCNSCHTAAGAKDAPGRIMAP